MDLDHLKKLVDAAIEGSDDRAQDELEAYDELARMALAWVAADKNAEIAAAAQLKAELAVDFGAGPLSDRERQLADANAWLAVQCAAEQRADQAMRIAASRLAVMTAPAKDDPANLAVALDSADSSAANRFTAPESGNVGHHIRATPPKIATFPVTDEMARSFVPHLARCDGKHEAPRCQDLLCWRSER